jgi:hypothetical protein
MSTGGNVTYPPQWGQPPGDPHHNFQEPLTYPSGYIPTQQGWGGYEAPPLDGPPPPNRRRVPLIIGVVVTVVAVTLALGALAWWQWGSGRGDNDRSAAVATTTSAANENPPTSTAPAAAAPPACAGKIAKNTPDTPAGWLPVDSPRGLTYSVPGDWTVNGCTTLVGWEKSCPDGPFGFCPIRTMSGSAVLPNKACPNTNRALTGVPGAASAEDIDDAVQRESQSVADIYTSDSGVVPKVSLSRPRPLTVGGAPAVQIVATVTGIAADDCNGTSALHSMVATTVPGQPGSVLFVISLQQGYPGAPDPGLLDQIVQTLNRTK